MFVPGTNDPGLLDRAMRTSVADSLDYILQAAGQHLALPPAQARSTIEAIHAHRVAPSLFGRYYKLVLAVQDGNYHQARELLTRISDTARHIPEFSADAYDEPSLGEDFELYAGLIDPNPGSSPWLCSPDPPEPFGPRVTECLRLIAVADPALADELSGLVIQVVGAVPFKGPNARLFGSASSFMLWGLLVINLERYRTPADLVQGLVHEAAHLLLFAHSIDQPLVTNPIEERYLSPLRSDPRPMDGVFHATFVAARMHHVNRKLREAYSATFRPVPLDELDARLADLKERYFGALDTVRNHARLSSTGQQILQETLDYMQTV